MFFSFMVLSAAWNETLSKNNYAAGALALPWNVNSIKAGTAFESPLDLQPLGQGLAPVGAW